MDLVHYDFWQYFLLGWAALAASTLPAITGFGGAAVLLPVLVAVFGVRDSIPILTIAQLIGNGSRVYFNRKEVQWKMVGWFSVGAIPCALIGGWLFTKAPAGFLVRFLGVFLILVVVWRQLRRGKSRPIHLKQFGILGAVSSFLSALVGSVGPFMAPFFLAYGLVKGAYIGTEAMSTVVMHIFKLVAYRQGAILNPKIIGEGLALGPIMIFGSFLGKKILNRMPKHLFVLLIEATLVIAGLNFLIRG